MISWLYGSINYIPTWIMINGLSKNALCGVEVRVRMAAWASRECANETGTHTCTNTHTHYITLHYTICNDSVTHIRLHLYMCLFSGLSGFITGLPSNAHTIYTHTCKPTLGPYYMHLWLITPIYATTHTHTPTLTALLYTHSASHANATGVACRCTCTICIMWHTCT